MWVTGVIEKDSNLHALTWPLKNGFEFDTSMIMMMMRLSIEYEQQLAKHQSEARNLPM